MPTLGSSPPHVHAEHSKGASTRAAEKAFELRVPGDLLRTPSSLFWQTVDSQVLLTGELQTECQPQRIRRLTRVIPP